MSKLGLTEILPEVNKIMKKAEDWGLEYEVIAQMIINTHEAKSTDVINRMWGALVDWDIPIQNDEDEFNKHLNNSIEG